jgi:hypothetical protein
MNIWKNEERLISGTFVVVFSGTGESLGQERDTAKKRPRLQQLRKH